MTELDPTLVDGEARRRIREDLDTTFVVEAAAGTGKTTELVRRILELVSRGRGTLARLVAVTFTDKAAGEMKLRIRSEIERARLDPRTDSAARAHLDRALAELEAARIGTIHSLCTDLLRERPVEAHVDPAFEVGDKEDASRLVDEAFDQWFQGVLADPPESVRRALRRRGAANDEGPRDRLRDAAKQLIDNRDFDAPWARRELDRAAEIDAVLTHLLTVAQLAERAKSAADPLAKRLQALGRFLDELRLREQVLGEVDVDARESELARLVRDREIWSSRKGSGRFFADGLSRDQVLDALAEAKTKLEALLVRLDADLASSLHASLSEVIGFYESRKERAGRLDFLDLLSRTVALLRRDAAVRAELQRRFTHVFVDEFQDTDPLQAELLVLLSAADPAETDWTRARIAPGKLFVVGDPKQAIYRFRRADVVLYEHTKRQLVAASSAQVLELTTSFRGTPGVQSAVNAAFAPRMLGDDTGSQARYVPLSPRRPPRPTQPELVVLPTPAPYGDWHAVKKGAVEEQCPDVVGAFLAWLVQKSGWLVSEDGVDVPVAARHVCLLFKRFQGWGSDVTRPYVRALEARGVPHVLVGGRSFHGREEVLAIRAALTAIEWPEDALAVYATLRGPLFSFADDVLLAYASHVGSLHPLRPLDPAPLPPSLAEVREALELLARLHRRRNRRHIAETLSELLATTRAHASFACWPTGEQALANVLRVLDLARRFEKSAITSFRAFVESLQEAAENQESPEAPVVEDGMDGVRLMTVHGAKGLEFPVVVLCDPTAPLVPRNPSQHVEPRARLLAKTLAGCAPWELVEHRDEALQRDADEAVRLVYVAATRARDLLVVPCVGDTPVDGWVSVLHPSLYPREGTRRAPEVAPGCPPFGRDTVEQRPPELEHLSEKSVMPGLHVPEVGAHGVVWWDPAVLALGAAERGGIRQERILAADRRPDAAARGVAEHDAWQKRRIDAIERGGRPSLVTLTVTEAAQLAPSSGAPMVAVAEVAPGRARHVGGKRFGTLVHAMLADADFDASETQLSQLAAVHGRLLGATPAELTEAIDTVRAALAHPILQRVAKAAEVRRESPVTLTREDGTLVEGVIDLAFREEGQGWWILDFKTDHELGARQSEYEAQVELYAEAVRVATGEPARAVLLKV